MCRDGFFDLKANHSTGCIPCSCVLDGTKNRNISCHTTTGQCDCKDRVTGQTFSFICMHLEENYVNDKKSLLRNHVLFVLVMLPNCNQNLRLNISQLLAFGVIAMVCLSFSCITQHTSWQK